MKKIILILLLLTTIAVASRYFFPDEYHFSSPGVSHIKDNNIRNIDSEGLSAQEGIIYIPMDVPEHPVALVEDAVYKDFSEVADADIYELLPGHTMGWVRKDNDKFYPGKIRVSQGKIAVKDNTIVAGLFMLDMKSLQLDEPNEDLLEDMKSEDFLDVINYPEASFVLQETNPDTISGILTFKGVSKKITFPALVMITNKKIRIFSDFTIDRTERGIVPHSDSISIYLDLSLDWVLRKQPSS